MVNALSRRAQSSATLALTMPVVVMLNARQQPDSQGIARGTARSVPIGRVGRGWDPSQRKRRVEILLRRASVEAPQYGHRLARERAPRLRRSEVSTQSSLVTSGLLSCAQLAAIQSPLAALAAPGRKPDHLGKRAVGHSPMPVGILTAKKILLCRTAAKMHSSNRADSTNRKPFDMPNDP